MRQGAAVTVKRPAVSGLGARAHAGALPPASRDTDGLDHDGASRWPDGREMTGARQTGRSADREERPAVGRSQTLRGGDCQEQPPGTDPQTVGVGALREGIDADSGFPLQRCGCLYTREASRPTGRDAHSSGRSARPYSGNSRPDGTGISPVCWVRVRRASAATRLSCGDACGGHPKPPPREDSAGCSPGTRMGGPGSPS